MTEESQRSEVAAAAFGNIKSTIQCPDCGSMVNDVTDSRGYQSAGRIRRRRKCENNHRFTTIELPADEVRRLESVDAKFATLLSILGIKPPHAHSAVEQGVEVVEGHPAAPVVATSKNGGAL